MLGAALCGSSSTRTTLRIILKPENYSGVSTTEILTAQGKSGSCDGGGGGTSTSTSTTTSTSTVVVVLVVVVAEVVP